MDKTQDKKTKTIQTYNLLAEDLSEGYDEYFKKIVQPEANLFLSNIINSGRILDAGCGAGTHSLYFKEKGYKVVGVDLSPGMVSLCKSKGLDATVMDLENLEFEENSFDGVWCHTSLIHFENKKILKKTLEKISKILKPICPLFVALREGQHVKWELYHSIKGTERWFLYFKQGEFEKYVPPELKIERFTRTRYKDHSFLNYHIFHRD